MPRFISCFRVLILTLCLQVLPALAQIDPPPENRPSDPAIALPLPAPVSLAPMTFNELLERARLGNPQWAAARTLPTAAEGDLLQAGMRPNPVIGLSTGVEAPFRSTGTNLSLSQELELGGKRRARLEEAKAQLEFARQKAREVERELLLELRNAYIDLLYAQELLDLRTEALHLSEESLELTRGRLKAGDVAGIERGRYL